ncbi:hypothetical protein GOBAR_DD08838 [Gossypium barbadense]|nr:hypothetical protein GOBAR_DD08838 [Gossypium barbadense]
MAVGREDVEILKPRIDKREYRRIVLRNSLQHGGSTNAFTASEMTNYFFDVNIDCFEEALDRFAQFLIKPLMSADATMREIKTVDSGTKFFVVCEPGTQHMEALLKVVYELYTDYVLKNPFYEMEMPIRFELFDINLTQAVQKDRVALLGR